jgi:hypothetical protein
VTDDSRFEWLGKPGTPETPDERHVATLWSMRGPTGKPITCEIWQVATGLEVRAMRAGELYRSQLCRGPVPRDEAIAVANSWRRVLSAKGFSETE